MSLAAMLFWFGLTTVLPVLPRFVRDELGGGDVMVGLVVGSLAIGAIMARPQLGRLGDTRGRRLLLVGGGAVASLAMFGHLLVTTEAPLFALRILLGLGQASFMVGVTTMAVTQVTAKRDQIACCPNCRRRDSITVRQLLGQIGMFVDTTSTK